MPSDDPSTISLGSYGPVLNSQSTADDKLQLVLGSVNGLPAYFLRAGSGPYIAIPDGYTTPVNPP